MINFIEKDKIKHPFYHYEIPLYEKLFNVGILDVVVELNVEIEDGKNGLYFVKILNIYIIDYDKNIYINIETFINNIFSENIIEYIHQYIDEFFDDYDNFLT